jgi:hypothetical protein
VLSENLADKLDGIKATAASFFLDATDKATSLDDYLVDSIGSSVSNRVDAWLIDHPFISWLVAHPLISLVSSLIAIVLTIRLLVTVYRAIANAIDRIWLQILRSPWLLLKFFFGWETKPKTVAAANTTITNYEVTNNPEYLQEIMIRLEKIQQQQEQLIQDIAMLKQQHQTIEPKQIQLTTEKIIGDRN